MAKGFAIARGASLTDANALIASK